MFFSDNEIALGKCRVSSARVNAQGDTGFVMAIAGALVYKVIPANSKQPLFSTGQIISYADDCFVLDNGLLHRRGDYTYEQN
jgi:hypothetical protein